MSNDDQTGRDDRGNGQQGTGGLGSGRATSTPHQTGGQPHLGNAAQRSGQSAPGGTGETEGASAAGMTAPADHPELGAMDRARAADGSHTSAARHNDRLDTIELADDRTEALNPRRGAGTNAPSADQLSGAPSNEGYVSDAHRETPTLGAIDDDADNM